MNLRHTILGLNRTRDRIGDEIARLRALTPRHDDDSFALDDRIAALEDAAQGLEQAVEALRLADGVIFRPGLVA